MCSAGEPLQEAACPGQLWSITWLESNKCEERPLKQPGPILLVEALANSSTSQNMSLIAHEVRWRINKTRPCPLLT